MFPPLCDLLLRKVPEHFAAGVSSGELRVYGSVIRSLVTGRIVGHLQETSGLGGLVANLLTAPASLPMQASGLLVDAAGHSISYAQNAQIGRMLGGLQSMQLTGLVLGTAAIGVSIAGFAVLSRKLDRIETKLDSIEPKLHEIARALDAIRADQVAEDFVRLRTALEQLDEGWLLANPAEQWRSVAKEAHFLANQFHRRTAELLDSSVAHVHLAEPFSEALSLALNARVTARMAAGDDLAALSAAEEGALMVIELGQRVRLGEAVLAAMPTEAEPGTVQWGEQLTSTTETLRVLVGGHRAREDAAAATCLTLSNLLRQQIPCQAWLAVAREETDSPLLCLLADGP